MSQLTVYWYPKCSTCRNAVKWLQARGHELNLIDIFEKPPGAASLKKLIRQSGLGVRKFFNTSGEAYKEMKLKDQLPQMAEEEMIKLLASNGRLIKRPIVTDGKRATVGFKETELENVW